MPSDVLAVTLLAHLGPEALGALAGQTGEVATGAPVLTGPVREAFAAATQNMYSLGLGFVVVGWIATLFVPAVPLRKTFGDAAGRGTEIGAAEGQPVEPEVAPAVPVH